MKEIKHFLDVKLGYKVKKESFIYILIKYINI